MTDLAVQNVNFPVAEQFFWGYQLLYLDLPNVSGVDLGVISKCCPTSYYLGWDKWVIPLGGAECDWICQTVPFLWVSVSLLSCYTDKN